MPLSPLRAPRGARRCAGLLLAAFAAGPGAPVAQQLSPKDPATESGAIEAVFDGEPRRLGVALDANYRWLYDAEGKSCDSASPAAMEACYLQGLGQAAYEGTYGIYVGGADPTRVTLKYAALGQYATKPNYGTRVFLTDLTSGQGYGVFRLLGGELSFEMDLSRVPAGMNAAVYLVSMDPDGGLGAAHDGGGSNGAGWRRGVGYCDAQCPTDVKFVQDLGWRRGGTVMSCCPEMDLFEGNRFAAAMTAHPCSTASRSTCDTTAAECANPCDTDGADVNLFRRHGPGSALFELINPAKPITVRTRFHVDEAGALSSITQTYEQAAADGSTASFSMNLTDGAASAQKALFSEPDAFAAIGGLAQMGAAMDRGMVLVLAIWADAAGNMNWLDSCKANASVYDCEAHSRFYSKDVYEDAWAQSPGAWRGPADQYPDFASSFATRTVTFSYPGIPAWMASQPMFDCAKVGEKFDCSANDYQFSVRGIHMRSLGEPRAGHLPWYAWLAISVAAALAIVAGTVLIRFWQGGRRRGEDRKLCGHGSDSGSSSAGE